MTLCNMAVEAGGTSGVCMPDETTVDWLWPFIGPEGEARFATKAEALAAYSIWKSDPDAVYDKIVTIDCSSLEPLATFGYSPDKVKPAREMADVAVDQVYIGSCTNGRIEDLRAAANIADGRRVAPGVAAWVVPGSTLVKLQAEAEGLDRIFTAAGFEWRHAGCSMCLATNGDHVAPGKRCASTSNRNFVGRQGPESRTHLMSPAMAAAAAVTGRLTDVRQLIARS